MTKRREFIKRSALATSAIAIGGMGFSSKTYLLSSALMNESM